MKTKRNADFFMYVLLGLVAGLLLGIAALAIFLVQQRLWDAAPAAPVPATGTTEFDGIIALEPPVALPDFSLLNQQGQATRLSDLRGRFTLLTFGFTHCPDICPMTLSDFWQAREMLADQARDLHFVFISVDGARDKPAVLREYFAFRQLDDFIALTGSDAALRELGVPFGLFFEKSAEASPGNYLVNHTVGAFLLDRQSRWIRRYQFGLPPRAIVADLQALLAA